MFISKKELKELRDNVAALKKQVTPKTKSYWGRDIWGFTFSAFHNDEPTIVDRVENLESRLTLLLKRLGLVYQTDCGEKLPKLATVKKGKK